MNPSLRSFLTSSELDDLFPARADITTLSPDDAAAIKQILAEWQDLQAVSNLLMHPDLIPADVRLDNLLKGLQESEFRYFTLAAIVGLSGLDNLELTSAGQPIVEAMIEAVATDDGVIAGRSSVFLAGKLQVFEGDYAERLVVFLDHPNEAVKHNVLVALNSCVGLFQLGDIVEAAVQAGKISSSAGAFAKKKLEAAHKSFMDDDSFGMGGLSVPLLPYIPNLVDF